MTTPPPTNPTGERAAAPGDGPAPAPGAPPALADRLREVVVEVRGELDISRHVFRDGPAYVVRDPITFATHRFDPADYLVFASLRKEWTLGETFRSLVAAGDFTDAEEEDFYAFVLDLHQRNLLTLPVNNADALYQRFERRRRAENLSRLLGVFFLRVPLVNPDRFLSRTVGAFRWLFTWPALVAWAALCLAAGGVVAARFAEFAAPATSILNGDNLALLWVALIGLKVVHEFGHAYACKAFGGHVPEMGALFILFTPVAYVDATDSWTFSSARRRAIVTLGGVYFESIVGAFAVFVWAMTGPSVLNAFAYQVVILATITTAAFNLNPLLRYDAYYLLSDLLAIPNLRQRCQEALAACVKKIVFGLRLDAGGDALRPRPGLALFGLAQFAYRLVMLATITTVLILKFHTLGMAMAGVMVGLTAVKSVAKGARYVLFSEELAPVRARAVVGTFGLAGGLVTAALLVPVPWPVHAEGVVSFERVGLVRAPVSGTLTDLPRNVGATVYAGDRIAAIENDETVAEYRAVLNEVEADGARVAAAMVDSPAGAMQALAESGAARARAERLADEIARGSIVASEPGRVLALHEPHPGVHVATGDPLLLFATGEPEAVFHVRAFEFDTLRLREGDRLACRSRARPDDEIVGTVEHIARVGGRDIDARIAHTTPAGLVPLSPQDGRAVEPFFEIRLRLHPSDADLAGARLVAELPTHGRTTAAVLERRIRRFLNRVREGASR